MYPALSLRNFTPTSTALLSGSAPAGVAEVAQMLLTGGGGAAVVNDQIMLVASALPAASLTRGSLAPPLTVAVYVVEVASAADGCSVTVFDALLYTALAATSAFAGVRSSIVEVEIV